MLSAIYRIVLPYAHALRHRWRKLRKVRLEVVSVVARDLEGKVLLVRHSYGPHGWFLPSGGMKRGEDPVATARRELAEETGCTMEGARLVGQIEEELSGSPHTAHIVACITQDVPRPDRREVLEARFFPTHSLPEPLGPRTRSRLDFFLDPANAAQG